MMRPATGLYGSNFLENFDGVDITWQHSVGETTFTVQAIGGVVRKAQAPKEYKSNAEVGKTVADDPKAIGYIDKSAVDDTVKVILTLQ